jgi:hypothetical protein
MSKKASVDFLSGFRAMDEREGVQRHPKPPTQPIEIQPEPSPVMGRAQQQSRQGKVAITQWVDPVVRKQLAQLALDLDTSQAALIAESLNLLFEKHGKPPIASA